MTIVDILQYRVVVLGAFLVATSATVVWLLGVTVSQARRLSRLDVPAVNGHSSLDNQHVVRR